MPVDLLPEFTSVELNNDRVHISVKTASDEDLEIRVKPEDIWRLGYLFWKASYDVIPPQHPETVADVLEDPSVQVQVDEKKLPGTDLEKEVVDTLEIRKILGPVAQIWDFCDQLDAAFATRAPSKTAVTKVLKQIDDAKSKQPVVIWDAENMEIEFNDGFTISYSEKLGAFLPGERKNAG